MESTTVLNLTIRIGGEPQVNEQFYQENQLY